MGVDLSLKAIPKIGKKLIDKSVSRRGTEFADLLFFTFSAFQANFNDFDNPEWIEFKNDVRALIPFYNDDNYRHKFQLNTNRLYEVIDYLIAQVLVENQKQPIDFRIKESFFYSGIECDFCKGVQGYILKYWDLDLIKERRKLINSFSFERLFSKYHEMDMIDQGVYKIDQIKSAPKEKIKSVFNQTKEFLKNAENLGGYVLICKD